MKAIIEKFSIKFFLFLILAILITNVPFVGNYVKVVNTVIHESGHAIIALFWGKVENISLFMNTEGVTYSRQSTWVGVLFTSLAGYVFSSFMAFLAFWLIGRSHYRILITILLVLIGLNLGLWVRNMYGLIWLITFGAGFLFLLFKGSPTVINNVLLLIASILLVVSITSAYDILVLSFIQPESAGDASNLGKLTKFLPVQFWGIFFFFQSIWFGFMGMRKGIFRLGK